VAFGPSALLGDVRSSRGRTCAGVAKAGRGRTPPLADALHDERRHRIAAPHPPTPTTPNPATHPQTPPTHPNTPKQPPTNPAPLLYLSTPHTPTPLPLKLTPRHATNPPKSAPPTPKPQHTASPRSPRYPTPGDTHATNPHAEPGLATGGTTQPACTDPTTGY